MASPTKSESNQDDAKQYITEPWSSSFDPSSLSPETLYDMAVLLLQPSSVKLGIPTTKLRLFLSLAQANYRQNAYHCWAHAVHVTFNAYRLLQDLKDLESFDDFDVFVLLFSALIHDLDHPGHSNMMEISNNSKMARLYNDQSVIENNSICIAYNLVHDINLFSDLTTEMQGMLRTRCVELVLATDISPPSGKDRAMLVEAKWNAMVQAMGNSGGSVGSEASGGVDCEFKIVTTEQRQRVSIMLLNIADLGSAMQPVNVFSNWSQRLYIENNKSTGLTQEQHIKTQQPFMQYLCLPLLQFASKYPILKNINVYLNLLQNNLDTWNEMNTVKRCSVITAAYVVQPGVVQSNLVGNDVAMECVKGGVGVGAKQ